jgi:ABC-2 type transport system permease protein
MSRFLSVNPAWWELIRLTSRDLLTYRLDIVMTAFTFMVEVFVTRAIWEAVYAGRPEVDGVSAHTLLVYITIALLGTWLLPGRAAWIIQERVLSGDVALDLVRPFGFLKQVMAQETGVVFGYVPCLVAYLPAALLVGSLDPPPGANILLYLVSFGLAFVVNMLIGIHIGLLAFWMQNVNGVRAMYGVTRAFLSGAMVPLWLMPDGVRIVFQLLPFQALAFLPASIYSGQVTGWEALGPLAVQLAWVGILFLSAHAIWRRAQDRLTIHGG